MKQHKWHKEIKAWADGAELQWYNDIRKVWTDHDNENEGEPQWTVGVKWRIKPQPKEPKYLYVYLDDNYEFSPVKLKMNDNWQYIGKIKIEVEDCPS